MKYFVVTLLGLLSLVGSAHAESSDRSPEKSPDKSLRDRVISEWGQAQDTMRLILNDAQQVRRLQPPNRLRPGIGELCLDLGAAFHRTLSAIGRTGALLEDVSENKEQLGLLSEIRVSISSLTDICMPESALDWETRMPEFEEEVVHLLDLREKLIKSL